MTNAQMLDVGALLVGVPMLDPATITAGAGNDGSEVNGLAVDRLALPLSANGGPALSAQVAIACKAVLAEAATLSFAGNLQDDTASAFNATPADYAVTRARVLNRDGTLTELTLNATGGVDAVVVATGPSGGATVYVTVLLDVNLKKARQYLRLQRTLNLSAANTDTVLDYAHCTLGGLGEAPAA